MRILVLSDSHGFESGLFRAIAQQPSARDVLFLGDGLRDIEYVRSHFPELSFTCVRGNNDFSATEPAERLVELGGKRIFLAHGHTYGVKGTDYHLLSAAKSNGADIAVYGHTHTPVTRYEEGIYLMNPGSVREGSYGIIDITAGGIVCVLHRL
ncbi:MAG TPA: metallophosphoesterase [Candidatus Onthovicinus excrementipullorum]|nr:metallophosphoesterase [Candidatus Onthovicinus excrementipullorum]